MMRLKSITLVAALGLGLGLAACETATPYQPLVTGHMTSGGFTDQQLEPGHFRVTFRGNSLTSRETVETYLLYRAAELTTREGFDWFEMVDRHTDRDRRTYYDPDPFYSRPGYLWGYWRPYWRFYGGRWGWRAWDPFWGDPFWGDAYDVRTIERFEAGAEIVMHHGPKPADMARAFDAHAVMDNLGPKIVRPVPKA
jgi:hypothetical protein